MSTGLDFSRCALSGRASARLAAIFATASRASFLTGCGDATSYPTSGMISGLCIRAAGDVARWIGSNCINGTLRAGRCGNSFEYFRHCDDGSWLRPFRQTPSPRSLYKKDYGHWPHESHRVTGMYTLWETSGIASKLAFQMTSVRGCWIYKQALRTISG